MSIRKVTVNLPEEQVRFLQEVASNEHLTVTDVLRRAINAEKFFVEQGQAGHKILVETEGRRIREVIRA